MHHARARPPGHGRRPARARAARARAPRLRDGRRWWSWCSGRSSSTRWSGSPSSRDQRPARARRGKSRGLESESDCLTDRSGRRGGSSTSPRQAAATAASSATRLPAQLGDASLVVARGEHAFALLNKFPYSSGHLMVAPCGMSPSSRDLEQDEAAEIHRADDARDRRAAAHLSPRRVQRRVEPRPGRRRLDRGAPARARRPALGRRHELHARARGHEGAPRAPLRDPRPPARGLGRPGS